MNWEKIHKDIRLRMNISLYGALAWNTAYALLNLGMGLWHRSFWFCSLAAYYVFLAVMRFFLVRYTSKNKPGEHMYDELRKYRSCGIVMLTMNLTLALIIFFMVYWNRTFKYHEIITITLATYTFTSFTLAIVNITKYRKYNSPVYSAAKAISLVFCIAKVKPAREPVSSTRASFIPSTTLPTYCRRSSSSMLINDASCSSS